MCYSSPELAAAQREMIERARRRRDRIENAAALAIIAALVAVVSLLPGATW